MHRESRGHPLLGQRFPKASTLWTNVNPQYCLKTLKGGSGLFVEQCRPVTPASQITCKEPPLLGTPCQRCSGTKKGAWSPGGFPKDHRSHLQLRLRASLALGAAKFPPTNQDHGPCSWWVLHRPHPGQKGMLTLGTVRIPAPRRQSRRVPVTSSREQATALQCR